MGSTCEGILTCDYSARLRRQRWARTVKDALGISFWLGVLTGAFVVAGGGHVGDFTDLGTYERYSTRPMKKYFHGISMVFPWARTPESEWNRLL